MKETLQDRLQREFWEKLRKNTMWRDSASGVIERHIDELLKEVISETIKAGVSVIEERDMLERAIGMTVIKFGSDREELKYLHEALESPNRSHQVTRVTR